MLALIGMASAFVATIYLILSGEHTTALWAFIAGVWALNTFIVAERE